MQLRRLRKRDSFRIGSKGRGWKTRLSSGLYNEVESGTILARNPRKGDLFFATEKGSSGADHD